MPLVLDDEQQLLRDTAREFLCDRSPVGRVRELRDCRDSVGFSRELWSEMAELGWAGIIFPEEYGGSGLGHAELGVVLEECGRQLAAQPILSTVLLAGGAVLLGGNETQLKEQLPPICAGERILALAFQEGSRHDPYAVATCAVRDGGGYRLSGEKRFVLDGPAADALVVLGRSAGEPGEREGLTLFLVPTDQEGLEITPLRTVDSRVNAHVRLNGVELGAEAVLGEPERAADVLDEVLDRATVGLSAEMLGSAEEAFDRTLAYLRERKQFGVPIGSFQALKHRAAQMFCELQLSRSVVLAALRALDRGDPERSALASMAKARCADTVFRVGNEAIQMHGGIGVTDEEEIGFFLKRARVTQLILGDAAFHRRRFAALRGF
ncbi:MAG: acyl-CoA dehydrogenase family protein [Myxococcota bacterium]